MKKNSKKTSEVHLSFGTRVTHLRDFSGKPIATIAAFRSREEPRDVAIGLSIWNRKDEYNRRLGTKIAIGRAESMSTRNCVGCSNRKLWITDETGKWNAILLAIFKNQTKLQLPRRVINVLRDRLAGDEVFQNMEDDQSSHLSLVPALSSNSSN